MTSLSFNTSDVTNKLNHYLHSFPLLCCVFQTQVCSYLCVRFFCSYLWVACCVFHLYRDSRVRIPDHVFFLCCVFPLAGFFFVVTSLQSGGFSAISIRRLFEVAVFPPFRVAFLPRHRFPAFFVLCVPDFFSDSCSNLQ